MLLLGHTGITLGAAVLLTGALTSNRSAQTKGDETSKPCANSSEAAPDSNCTSGERASWLTTLARRIDIRILLVGSLLPDIIDKPTGLLLFQDTLSSGRIYCHTLLFLILITIAGTYLYRRHSKTWLLVLAFGTFIHLICDQMWLMPGTLFWPLYGTAFEKIDIARWIPGMLYSLQTNPVTYLPELVGALILIWFAQALLRRRKTCAFIRHGQIH